MLNYSPRTAFSHRCSYFPGGRKQWVGWRQYHRLWIGCCDMQIVADPVRQAAQSRCSLWWVSQNTYWSVRATGLQSFKHVILFFFGMGTMVDFLQHEGTTDREREIMKMSVKTPASLNAHALSTRPSRPTGLWIQMRLALVIMFWVNNILNKISN